MFYILNTVLFSVAKHFYLYKANEKLYLTWLFGYVFARFFLYTHRIFFFSLVLEDLGNVVFFTYFTCSEFPRSVPQGLEFKILFLAQRWFLFLRRSKEVCCSHPWLGKFRERKYLFLSHLSSCSLELVEQLNPETLNV